MSYNLCYKIIKVGSQWHCVFRGEGYDSLKAAREAAEAKTAKLLTATTKAARLLAIELASVTKTAELLEVEARTARLLAARRHREVE